MVHFKLGKNMEYSWSCSGNESKLGLLRIFQEVELEILARDLSFFFDEIMNVHCGWYLHFKLGKNIEYSWSCSGNESKLGLLRIFQEVELEILARDPFFFWFHITNTDCGREMHFTGCKNMEYSWSCCCKH